MKTSTSQASNCRPIISKIVTALAVASVLGAMAVTPALKAAGVGGFAVAECAEDAVRVLVVNR